MSPRRWLVPALAALALAHSAARADAGVFVDRAEIVGCNGDNILVGDAEVDLNNVVDPATLTITAAPGTCAGYEFPAAPIFVPSGVSTVAFPVAPIDAPSCTLTLTFTWAAVAALQGPDFEPAAQINEITLDGSQCFLALPAVDVPTETTLRCGLGDDVPPSIVALDASISVTAWSTTTVDRIGPADPSCAPLRFFDPDGNPTLTELSTLTLPGESTYAAPFEVDPAVSPYLETACAYEVEIGEFTYPVLVRQEGCAVGQYAELPAAIDTGNHPVGLYQVDVYNPTRQPGAVQLALSGASDLVFAADVDSCMGLTCLRQLDAPGGARAPMLVQLGRHDDTVTIAGTDLAFDDPVVAPRTVAVTAFGFGTTLSASNLDLGVTSRAMPALEGVVPISTLHPIAIAIEDPTGALRIDNLATGFDACGDTACAAIAPPAGGGVIDIPVRCDAAMAEASATAADGSVRVTSVRYLDAAEPEVVAVAVSLRCEFDAGGGGGGDDPITDDDISDDDGEVSYYACSAGGIGGAGGGALLALALAAALTRPRRRRRSRH